MKYLLILSLLIQMRVHAQSNYKAYPKLSNIVAFAFLGRYDESLLLIETKKLNNQKESEFILLAENEAKIALINNWFNQLIGVDINNEKLSLQSLHLIRQANESEMELIKKAENAIELSKIVSDIEFIEGFKPKSPWYKGFAREIEEKNINYDHAYFDSINYNIRKRLDLMLDVIYKENKK